MIYSESGSKPSTKYCGREGFSSVVCLLLEVFIIHLQIICKVLAIGKSMVEVVNGAAGIFPAPFGSLLQEINGKLTIGFITSAAPCPNATNSWTTELNRLCPGSFADINKFLNVPTI